MDVPLVLCDDAAILILTFFLFLFYVYLPPRLGLWGSEGGVIDPKPSWVGVSH